MLKNITIFFSLFLLSTPIFAWECEKEPYESVFGDKEVYACGGDDVVAPWKSNNPVAIQISKVTNGHFINYPLFGGLEEYVSDRKAIEEYLKKMNLYNFKAVQISGLIIAYRTSDKKLLSISLFSKNKTNAIHEWRYDENGKIVAHASDGVATCTKDSPNSGKVGNHIYCGEAFNDMEKDLKESMQGL